MRKHLVFALAALGLFGLLPSSAWAGTQHRTVLADDDDGTLPLFGMPNLPGSDQPRMVLPPEANRHPKATPGVTAPLVPTAPRAQAAPSRSRAEVLDDLFKQLASAGDEDEAKGIASRIQRLWLQSDSDTADLLMERAAVVIAKGQPDIALQLLDKVVALDPTWAEGWNKRATLRFVRDDDAGSMSDIAHVLALEPRHFGALSGMATILERHGQKKEALAVLRKAAQIYPHNDDLRKQIDALSLEVEGRPI